MNEAADLIEQQQQRIVELEKERDFLVHEYERAVKCGSQGFSHAAGHLYNALINPRIDLKIVRKERDELAATVERLRSALQPFANYACSNIDECECHNCIARDTLQSTKEQDNE